MLQTGAVTARDIDGPHNTVNLTTGVCNCKNGQPFQWDATKGTWVNNKYCIHKIKAVADIIRRHPDEHTRGFDRREMVAGYIKMIAGRYNRWEAVSAFHKELRRADENAAYYWGCVLSNYRGLSGVLKYMGLNIIFEETRDFTLARWLLDKINKQQFDAATVHNAIVLFCRSKKKWDLPHRLPILEAEMRGYGQLIQQYGKAVAKASHIIDYDETDRLRKVLLQTFTKPNLAAFQYALKGLQKTNDPRGPSKLSDYRAELANDMLSHAETLSLPVLQRPYMQQYNQYLADRAAAGHAIGYHELNALGDLLTGEPYDKGNTTPEQLKWADTNQKTPDLQMGMLKVIPLYAQDNHTYAGKSLIQRYPQELAAGAEQSNLDLRMCGAYMGVTWRHLAVKQHGTIDCAWGEVDWPKWLYDTVVNLWY